MTVARQRTAEKYVDYVDFVEYEYLWNMSNMSTAWSIPYTRRTAISLGSVSMGCSGMLGSASMMGAESKEVMDHADRSTLSPAVLCASHGAKVGTARLQLAHHLTIRVYALRSH